MTKTATTHELEAFVTSLTVPAERKAVILAELLDHVASATEAALRAGQPPDAAAAAGRAAIGDLDALRGSLEAVEPAFHVSRWRAIVHGVVAIVAIVAAFELTALAGFGPVGVPIALAAAILLAPPLVSPRRALTALRAELRRSARIGPMATYILLAAHIPVAIGTVVIFANLAAGNEISALPYKATVSMALTLLLAVEAVRGHMIRRRAATTAV